MPQTYEQRKASFALYPERRAKINQQQAESRRRRKKRELEGTQPDHFRPDGKPCWLPMPHRHKTGLTPLG